MGNKKGSKLRRCMKSLVRLLSKPKDMYVHAITSCSIHFPYADSVMGMGFPAPNFSTLPRSFSVASYSPVPTRSSTSDDDDDLKHLLRSSSVRKSRTRGGSHHLPDHVELLDHHGCRKQTARLPWRCSIGRIDEDKPCEFGYDDQCDFKVVMPLPQGCPESRSSHAVHGRRRTRSSRVVF